MIPQYKKKVNYLDTKPPLGRFDSNGNNANGVCLIISNNESGKNKKPTPQKLMNYFDLTCNFDCFDGTQNIEDYLDIIVSGGDGTISNAINLCQNIRHNLFYRPTGTVNDFGRIKNRIESPILGKVNDKCFCYCLAAGTFTEIGYTARRNIKKRLGKLAYIFEAVKGFKVKKINASISTEKGNFEGTYTLVMVLRSNRCFGFNFNNLYNPNKKELYLLLVESPKNRASLFIKFFKCFFVGFRKNYNKKGILFTPVEWVNLGLYEENDFCIDGDKINLQGCVKVSPYEFNGKIITKK